MFRNYLIGLVIFAFFYTGAVSKTVLASDTVTKMTTTIRAQFHAACANRLATPPRFRFEAGTFENFAGTMVYKYSKSDSTQSAEQVPAFNENLRFILNTGPELLEPIIEFELKYLSGEARKKIHQIFSNYSGSGCEKDLETVGTTVVRDLRNSSILYYRYDYQLTARAKNDITLLTQSAISLLSSFWLEVEAIESSSDSPIIFRLALFEKEV